MKGISKQIRIREFNDSLEVTLLWCLFRVCHAGSLTLKNTDDIIITQRTSNFRTALSLTLMPANISLSLATKKSNNQNYQEKCHDSSVAIINLYKNESICYLLYME